MEWAKCNDCYDMALKKARHVNSTSKSKYLSSQAYALIKLGRYEEALAKATDAQALDPQNDLTKYRISESENQIQRTEFSYDCEEGLKYTLLFQLSIELDVN